MDDTNASDDVEPPSVMTLALAFNRLAFESLGGGLAAWAQRMIVDERRWLSEEEFLSASTICGILPGANQVNMAVFVGTRYRGTLGAIAAVSGLVVLPALAAMIVGFLYLRYREVGAVRHILAGMSYAAAGLTLSVAFRQGLHTLTSAVPFAIGLVTFVMSAVFRTPLWFSLVILAPVGFWWAWRRETHAIASAVRRTHPANILK